MEFLAADADACQLLVCGQLGIDCLAVLFHDCIYVCVFQLAPLDLLDIRIYQSIEFVGTLYYDTFVNEREVLQLVLDSSG